MKTTRTKGILASISKSPKSSYFTMRFGSAIGGGFSTRFVALEWMLSQMLCAGVPEPEQLRVIGLIDKELNRSLRCETIVTL